MFRFEFQMRIVQGMCALLLTALAVSATAQKQVRTFYDPGQRRPHEEYMVSIADNETLNGKYKRYFPDGKTEIEGTFIDGKRFLYAANFGKGRVDIYDSTFRPVRLSERSGVQGFELAFIRHVDAGRFAGCGQLRAEHPPPESHGTFFGMVPDLS